MKTKILTEEQFNSPVNQNRDNAIIGFRSIETETQQLNIAGVSGSDTITLTRDELNSFLQDWSAGYSAEEQYLSWDEKSLRIVNFLGLDE